MINSEKWNISLDLYDESKSPKEKGWYRIIDIYGNEMVDYFYGEPVMTGFGIGCWKNCRNPIFAWKEEKVDGTKAHDE